MDYRAHFIFRAQKKKIIFLSPTEFCRAQIKPTGLKCLLIAGSKKMLARKNFFFASSTIVCVINVISSFIPLFYLLLQLEMNKDILKVYMLRSKVEFGQILNLSGQNLNSNFDRTKLEFYFHEL